MFTKVAVVAVYLAVAYRMVEGHGRLMDPPGRSSLWRDAEHPLIKPYESIVEPNYNDNQLFCGGAQYQASLGGKCGVCGDAWDAEYPENVPPGIYAKGIIVRQYAEGSWISVEVEITTHHKGYFEFRLCPWDNVTMPITHDCLNGNLLKVTNLVTTQFNISDSPATGYYHVSVKLPDGVTCDQCVLQWRYHTGNSWGCDAPDDCGLGKGSQEEFYGCADIAIGTDPVVPPPGFREDDNVVGMSTSTSSTLQSSTTTAPTTTTSTTSTTSTAATTTTQPITSSSTGGNGFCDADPNGYVKIDGCYSYYRCVNGVPNKFDCPPGTKFDEASSTCKHEDQVTCM